MSVSLKIPTITYEQFDAEENNTISNWVLSNVIGEGIGEIL